MSSANPARPGTGRMIRTPTQNALVVYHNCFLYATVFSWFSGNYSRFYPKALIHSCTLVKILDK